MKPVPVHKGTLFIMKLCAACNCNNRRTPIRRGTALGTMPGPEVPSRSKRDECNVVRSMCRVCSRVQPCLPTSQPQRVAWTSQRASPKSSARVGWLQRIVSEQFVTLARENVGPEEIVFPTRRYCSNISQRCPPTTKRSHPVVLWGVGLRRGGQECLTLRAAAMYPHASR